MSVQNYDELMPHVGHNIACVTYGTIPAVWNVAVECEDCGLVLIDFDNPKLPPPSDLPYVVDQ